MLTLKERELLKKIFASQKKTCASVNGRPTKEYYEWLEEMAAHLIGDFILQQYECGGKTPTIKMSKIVIERRNSSKSGTAEEKLEKAMNNRETDSDKLRRRLSRRYAIVAKLKKRAISQERREYLTNELQNINEDIEKLREKVRKDKDFY